MVRTGKHMPADTQENTHKACSHMPLHPCSPSFHDHILQTLMCLLKVHEVTPNQRHAARPRS